MASVTQSFVDEYSQRAPSQLERDNWTPGTSGSRQGDDIFREFSVPVGVPALESSGPVDMSRNRLIKLGRNIIGDQEISQPVSGDDVTTTIDDDATWGVSDPSHTITETNTQNVGKVKESPSGSDYPLVS